MDKYKKYFRENTFSLTIFPNLYNKLESWEKKNEC